MKKKKITCPRCKGEGKVYSKRYGMKVTCPKCKRFGWIYKNNKHEISKV